MKKPPEISISRLALYLRFLEDYIKEKGPGVSISSLALAGSLSINHHQVRKDLSYFGKFGERGFGYHAEELRGKITGILGLDRKWKMCLCGAGNLGRALLAYRGFRQIHLDIVAVFDNDPQIIGKKIRGVKVHDAKNIQKVVKKLGVNISLIAVPASSAADVSAALYRSGVRAILNFAPIKLALPPDVKLRNVDLATELVNLTYFLAQ